MCLNKYFHTHTHKYIHTHTNIYKPTQIYIHTHTYSQSTFPFITNLGFIFDTNFNYDMHISNIFKLFILYKISSIRKLITKKSCSILINSHICSGLDYCNSLHCSLHSISITKIDSIIRASTRFTFNLSYSDYTTYISSLFSSHINGKF